MQWRLVRSAALLSSLVALAGCLMDATIDAKGAGTLTIRYRLTTEAQFNSAKMRMKSPHVTLTSATVDADKWATFKMEFADVTKLSTIEQFRNTVFSLVDDEAATKTLEVHFVNEKPSTLPQEMVAYFGKEVDISLNLPGEVVKSNAVVTRGKTVTWTYPLNDFMNMPEVHLSATFRVPAGEKERAKY